MTEMNDDLMHDATVNPHIIIRCHTQNSCSRTLSILFRLDEIFQRRSYLCFSELHASLLAQTDSGSCVNDVQMWEQTEKWNGEI